MSIEALNWAFNVRLENPLCKAVLIGIANHANPKGEAWPSVERLALYSGYTTRAVQKGIRQLQELGFMSVQERAGTTSLYALRLSGGEPRSGVNIVQGCTEFRGGVNEVRPNHQQPSTKQKEDKTTLLPEDWQPTAEDIEWAKQECPHVEVKHETDKFRDYWLTTGKRKSNWRFTWRNWIRRSRAVWAPRPTPIRSSPASVADANSQRVRQLLDDLYQHETPASRRVVEG